MWMVKLLHMERRICAKATVFLCNCYLCKLYHFFFEGLKAIRHENRHGFWSLCFWVSRNASSWHCIAINEKQYREKWNWAEIVNCYCYRFDYAISLQTREKKIMWWKRWYLIARKIYLECATHGKFPPKWFAMWSRALWNQQQLDWFCSFIFTTDLRSWHLKRLLKQS